MNPDPYEIFVTVGHPGGTLPVLDKARIFVDHDKGQTPVQAAKMLRKQVADNAKDYGFIDPVIFKPSQLYYEIYVNRHVERPYAESTNSPRLYLRKEY
jgi:hypothetical protein